MMRWTARSPRLRPRGSRRPASRSRCWPAALLLWLLVAGWASAPGQAAPALPGDAPGDPQAISLSYFRARGLADGVLLEWGTETEFDTAGFFVRRAGTQGGNYVDPGIGFVPAEGGELSGASYDAADTTAVPGQAYWYKLVEVEINGTENEYGPIRALAGVTPTPTSVVIIQPTSGATTPIPTSTGIPTSTPPPSPTVNTPTLPATATLTPSDTPSPEPPGTPTRTPIPLTGPTVTPFVFPTFSLPGDGVAEAAQGGTLTPGYPGPESEPDPGLGYPGPEVPTLAPPAVYPAPSDEQSPTLPAFPTSSGEPTLPAASGQSSQSLPPLSDAETAQDEPGQAARGRVLLWAGFVLALVVFGIGVYTAIVLSNRRPPGRR